MNVKELIENLQTVEDKTLPVKVSHDYCTQCNQDNVTVRVVVYEEADSVLMLLQNDDDF